MIDTCSFIMEFTRRDLVTTFPTRFSKSELRLHFSRAYERLVGCTPPSTCLETMTIAFMKEWKKCKKKETFLSSARGQNWLDKKLILPDGAQLAPEITPKRSDPDLKPRKPFKGTCTNLIYNMLLYTVHIMLYVRVRFRVQCPLGCKQ
jgi:hypothetical protein